MAEAGAAAGVLALVLDEMADIAHAVSPAPVPDLTGKILPDQPGDGIHVLAAYLGGLVCIRIRIPQKREARGPGRPPEVFQRGTTSSLQGRSSVSWRRRSNW